jgi:uncharacterized lipoprotein YbaY
MKKFLFLSGWAALAAVVFTGCEHLDLATEGDTNRVATGTVEFYHAATLPADAEMVVTVTDPAPAPPPLVPGPDQLPLLHRQVVATALPGPAILGVQTIQGLGSSPLSFRVEFQADDALLRRGLVIDVRISSHGKVIYLNRNQYGLSLGDIGEPHEIWVESMH